MSRNFTCVAVGLILLACTRQEPAVKQSGQVSLETDELRKRVKTLEADVLSGQKQDLKHQEQAEELRRRIAAIESRFQATEVSAPQQPSPRGGFITPAPVPEPPSSPAAASGDSIDARCTKEWGTNYRMLSYCKEQQQEAKAKLDRGNREHEINGSAFADIRRRCEGEWGTNYRMRAYCEGQQVEAYKKLNGQAR